MSNRRNYERLLIQKYAILRLTNGESIEGKTRDMSVGGAFIECEYDNDLGEGTECTISLMLDEGNEAVLTEMYASISHSEEEGLGCIFLKVNSGYYQFIGESSD